MLLGWRTQLSAMLELFKARPRSLPAAAAANVAKYSALAGTLPSAAALRGAVALRRVRCAGDIQWLRIQFTAFGPVPCNSGFADGLTDEPRVAGRPGALRADRPYRAERQQNKVPQNSCSLLGNSLSVRVRIVGET